MAFDWLFGPRVLSSGDFGVTFSAFRLDLSDIEDLMTALAEFHAPAHVFRRTRSEAGGLDVFDHELTDITAASDGDLRAIQIRANPGGITPDELHFATAPVGEAVLTLTPSLLTFSMAPMNPRLRDRVTRIITENGRRRIQPYKLMVLVRAILVSALSALPLWTLVSTRSWPVGLVAALSVWLAWREISLRLRNRSTFRGWDASRGRATIDTLSRNARRSERWNSRRDWKIGALTFAGTIIAAVVTGWATGVFG